MLQKKHIGLGNGLVRLPSRYMQGDTNIGGNRFKL